MVAVPGFRLIDIHSIHNRGDESAHSRFVCQIVGDGSFMFSVPSSVYWVAQKYKLPVLTVVLNNKGGSICAVQTEGKI